MCFLSILYDIFALIRRGVISIEGLEIRHSNFLAWLLDPSGNHNLGDYFLKRFLFAYVDSDNSGNLDVFDIDKMDLEDCIVYRELYHMDIIVESKESDFVLVIENKIHSDESINQTKKYREHVENVYKSVGNKFYVFLTLDMAEPQDSKWVPMSHYQTLKIVESCIERMPATSKGRFYVEDYKEVLIEMVDGDNSEIKTICEEIYSKHKNAIDLLIDNIPDSFQKRAGTIVELLEETGKVQIVHKNNSYISFTTKDLDERYHGLGTNEWYTTEDLLLFEIVNNRDGKIRFVLVVGPCKSPGYRNQIIDYMVASGPKAKKRKTEKWTRVYSHGHQIKDNLDETDQLRSWINDFVNKTIYGDLQPKLLSFPGFDNNLSE